MDSTFANQLLRAVRRTSFDVASVGPVLSEREGTADPERAQSAIGANGLGAFLFLLSRADADVPAEWGGRQGELVRQSLNNTRRFEHACDLAAALESAGIPAICYRGPFSGQRFHGDLGSRPFSDVDLIIPAHQTRAAWTFVRENGYRLFQRGMSPGYFRRHHIHWCIQQEESNLLCDLHWAVENPYALYRIDYDAIFAQSTWRSKAGRRWREPCAEHLFVLLSLHLSKHEPNAMRLVQDPGASRWLLEQRLFFKWLDIGLFIKREGTELDWDAIRETAAAWRATPALLAALKGCELFFGVPLPAAMASAVNKAADEARIFHPEGSGAWFTPKWLDAMFLRLGGFRSQRIGDFIAYMFPPGDYFRGPRWSRPLARVLHTVKATGQLAFGVLDTAFQFIRARWVRRTLVKAQSISNLSTVT